MLALSGATEADMYIETFRKPINLSANSSGLVTSRGVDAFAPRFLKSSILVISLLHRIRTEFRVRNRDSEVGVTVGWN